MPSKPNLSADQLKKVKDTLRRFPYRFFLFGSRARGQPKRFSDLDIFSPDTVPRAVVAEIRESFDNSDLPFKVDIVLAEDCPNEFLAEIKSSLIPLS